MKKRRKIFPRAAALLCCIILLPSLVAVPACAASDDQFFDVLEFGTANGSGSQVVSGTFPLSVVYQTVTVPFFYVDMVVTCNVSNLRVNYAGMPLEVVLINDSTGFTYRVYGDLVGDPSGYLTFTFSGDLPSGFSEGSIIFEQLRVSTMSHRMSVSHITGGIMSSNSSSEDDFRFMSNSDSPVHLYLTQYSSANHYYPYEGYVYVPDWAKYDYVDIFLDFFTSSIDSLGVLILTGEGKVSVPYTVNYISSDFENDFSFNPDVTLAYATRRQVLIRVDLTGIDRSLGDPVVFFNGLYDPWYGDNFISLLDVTGIIYGDTPSSLSIFWQRLQGLWIALHADLKTFFEGLFSGSDEFQAEVEQSVTDFDAAESEIDQGLDSLDTPDAGDVDIVGKIEASGAKTATLGDFFDTAFNNVVVNWLMILSFSFMLISFLLYGSFR